MRFAHKKRQGFTLVEVAIASSIAALILSGLISAYVQCTVQSEWAAYSMKAQYLALQRLEQARAAKWDLKASPPIDNLVQSNFPPVTEEIDVGSFETNDITASVVTAIQQVSQEPPLKLITVNCVWKVRSRLFTNSLVTYRTADQ